ncbi:response regulator [Desulfosporosinus metallidurans]|uniref:Stage 0 sporulation protein A homolog n=1 Tax=Desulfosporosinus metallidurans TaxID=1888891 RepID=A0A1Q8QWX9_9FIRM|nr:response regulator [Desulfosporosinus metallidurans]OLN31839.1 sensor histidine kinase [Desulfosporosinus metallidurans]
MENKGPRILIIDDETQIRRFLRVTLTGHGYVVKDVGTGKEGLDVVAKFSPDLVVLDLGLPDIDGLDVVRQLREWSKVPVIILSVKEHETDKIAALDAGADDYVTKPFGMGELLARIRAAMRHIAGADEQPVLQFDDLIIDLIHRRITVDDNEIKLTLTEYEIVKNLAINAGKVITHRALLRTVWGPSYENEVQYLRVYIGQIRRKLERDPSRPRHMITEPGVGYRLL